MQTRSRDDPKNASRTSNLHKRATNLGSGRKVLPFLAVLGVLLGGGCATDRGTGPLLADPPVASGAGESLRIRTPITSPSEEDAALQEARIVFNIDEDSETRYLDVWQRIREGFAIHHGRSQPRIDYWTQFFASRKRHLNDSAENSRLFIHHILEQVDARDMPAELALLPLIESSFDPFAGGGDRASGLWQFMPITARRFGMDYAPGYQARRDVIRSTHAALDYLAWLYSRYNDWALALAAYNAGEGRVDRAIARNRLAGKPDDFWSLDLPEETQNYVPKLLALARIVDEPDRYEMQWPRIANQPAFTAIEFPPATRLSLAAELLDISTDDLNRLNPALEHGATPPGEHFAVLVPAAHADTLRERLSELQGLVDLNPAPPPRSTWTPAPASAPKTARPENTRRKHRVVAGDTLYDLARKYRVSVGDLRKWNGLKSGKPIRIGQTLTVQSPPRVIIYHVRKGDSLWGIARQHGVHVSQLRSWNKMKKDRPLKPGQKLKIHIESI